MLCVVSLPVYLLCFTMIGWEGADLVFLGRTILWGLTVGGQAGVEKVIEVAVVGVVVVAVVVVSVVAITA